MFQFHVTSPADRKYIILRTYTIHYSSGPLHILMHPSQPATKDNYQSASNLYHENVIVVRSDYAQISLLLFIVLKNVMVNYHFIEVIMFIC